MKKKGIPAVGEFAFSFSSAFGFLSDPGECIRQEGKGEEEIMISRQAKLCLAIITFSSSVSISKGNKRPVGNTWKGFTADILFRL